MLVKRRMYFELLRIRVQLINFAVVRQIVEDLREAPRRLDLLSLTK